MIKVANSVIAWPLSDAERELIFGLICSVRTICYQCE
jgi:hypothetical protein